MGHADPVPSQDINRSFTHRAGRTDAAFLELRTQKFARQLQIRRFGGRRDCTPVERWQAGFSLIEEHNRHEPLESAETLARECDVGIRNGDDWRSESGCGQCSVQPSADHQPDRRQWRSHFGSSCHAV